MNIGEAVVALRAGKKVTRTYWGKVAGRVGPDALVLIPGREITASYKPMVDHVGEGAKMTVADHVDAIWFDGRYTSAPCFVVVGYVFTQDDVLADDWSVLD